MMYDVITIGSATRDMFLKSRAFEIIESKDGRKYEAIPFGQKFRVDEVAFASGGGGTNTAVTFARQGLKTACLSIIGDDSTGRDIIEEMRSEGVDTSMFIRHPHLASAFSVILVHPTGERSILSFKGEGQHFITSEIDFSRLQTSLIYVDSTGGNIDFLNKIAEHVKTNNLTMAWNPGGLDIEHGISGLLGVLNSSKLFFLNKEEACKLLGMGSLNIDIRQVLNKLRGFNSNTIFTITDGKNGSYTIDIDGSILYADIPDSPVIDATGAGDAFASAFTAQYILNADLEESIKSGVANASSVVAHYGAKAGILSKNNFGLLNGIKVQKI